MVLDQDRRWRAVQAVSRFGHPAAARLLVQERARDASDQGRLAAITAQASRPDHATKAQWVEALLSAEAELPLADVRAATRALFPDHQHALHLAFSAEILARLPALDGSRDAGYFGPTAQGLVRPVCSAAYLGRLDAAVEAGTGLHPSLSRHLLETRFAVRRCLAIGERLAAND